MPSICVQQDDGDPHGSGEGNHVLPQEPEVLGYSQLQEGMER